MIQASACSNQLIQDTNIKNSDKTVRTVAVPFVRVVVGIPRAAAVDYSVTNALLAYEPSAFALDPVREILARL